MKILTVRLPEPLVAQIEAESRTRQMSKADVVRERLVRGVPGKQQTSPATYEAIYDLIGSIDGLPRDLGARRKHYLKATKYGRKRHR